LFDQIFCQKVFIKNNVHCFLLQTNPWKLKSRLLFQIFYISYYSSIRILAIIAILEY